jgi:hypothetical protein
MILHGHDDMRKRQNEPTPSQELERAIKRVRIKEPAVNDTKPTEVPDSQHDPTRMSSASEHFGNRTLSNRGCRQQGAIASSKRRYIARTHTGTSNPIDYTGRYCLEVNTTCCSKGFVPITEVDMVCDVAGFHPTMDKIKDVPIQTCACAYDCATGETLILAFSQALWFGDDMEHSLLSPNQARAFSHQLCLNPKQYRNYGLGMTWNIHYSVRIKHVLSLINFV